MRGGIALLLGAMMAAGGLMGVGRTHADLQVFDQPVAGRPATHYYPRVTALGTVVVAHGFAGNRAMMRPWGLALARQGLIAVLVDLPGHGAATDGLGTDRAALGAALRAVVDDLIAQRLTAPGRLGLLGQGMGGAAVQAAAAGDARIAATVVLGGRPTADPGAVRNLLAIVAERDLPGLSEEWAAALPGLEPEMPPPEHLAAGSADRWTLLSGRSRSTLLHDPDAHALVARWMAAGMHTQAAAGAVGSPARGYGWSWAGLGMVGALLLFAGAAMATVPQAEAALARKSGVRPTVRVPPLLLVVLVAVAGLAAALFSQQWTLFPWVPYLVTGDLLTIFLVMAAVLLAARFLLPDDFGTGEPEPLGPTLRSALLGLFLGAVFLAASAPLVHRTISHMIPVGPRLWWLLPVTLFLWPYLVQEEAIRAAAAAGERHLTARLAVVAGSLVLALIFAATSLLPGGGGFLPLVAPGTAILLPVTALLGYILDRLGHRPATVAAARSLVLAWFLVLLLPLA